MWQWHDFNFYSSVNSWLEFKQTNYKIMNSWDYPLCGNTRRKIKNDPSEWVEKHKVNTVRHSAKEAIDVTCWLLICHKRHPLCFKLKHLQKQVHDMQVSGNYVMYVCSVVILEFVAHSDCRVGVLKMFMRKIMWCILTTVHI